MCAILACCIDANYSSIMVSVIVEAAGVSRRNVLSRLREQREVLTRCPRYGPVRAYVAWLDKLWRFPIAQLLNISH